MAKKKTTPKQEMPSFEEALSDLQTIVGQLEEGELGLEESLEQYEKGTGLLRHCFSVLKNAEQRIELLTGEDAEGNLETEPFDASATLDQREQSAGRRKQNKSASPKEDEAAGRNLFGE
ncbi:MAG TPA: exodeoxyribonuclease VII small subunit [Planctomycetaceae bacterium]|nr:exodeoxyribonuclease VII small subunit [Planctomycetaceae bacterium]|tara:strand:+ start:95 stop:451 length:357 start_codon:yes stop_codon:yes gene_type:complete